MIMQIERIIPEDEQLRKYGIFLKVKSNGHDRHNEDYNTLSEKDLGEIEELMAFEEDSQ